jgi:ribosomal protein S18 acetylase RimI-like enzyme
LGREVALSPSDAQSGFLIRLFVAADQDAARWLILHGLGERFGFIDASYTPDLDDITASYLAVGHVFLVAEMDGALAGTGALLIEAEGIGRMARVSVSREQRGKGLGRALVEHLLGLARARRLRRVVVETNRDWNDAIGLYQRCGFSAYAQDEVSISLGIDLSR